MSSFLLDWYTFLVESQLGSNESLQTCRYPKHHPQAGTRLVTRMHAKACSVWLRKFLCISKPCKKPHSKVTRPLWSLEICLAIPIYSTVLVQRSTVKILPSPIHFSAPFAPLGVLYICSETSNSIPRRQINQFHNTKFFLSLWIKQYNCYFPYLGSPSRVRAYWSLDLGPLDRYFGRVDRSI